jgi:hypothetical protein
MSKLTGQEKYVEKHKQKIMKYRKRLMKDLKVNGWC